MASKNEVTLTFAGDSAQLEKAFDKVDEAAGGLETSVKKASKATDEHANATARLGEKADNSERNLIGVHDVIDGTATIMQGPGKAGIVAYVQGWADLAGGAAPLLSSLSAVSLASAKAGIAQATAAARTVAGWIAARIAAMASAIQIAAAWLISLGPVVLVVAGIAAVVAAFVILWNKSAAFRNFWKGLWNNIKQFAGEAKDWIVGRWNSMITFITGLPGRIGRATRGMWDGIKNAFRAAINWIIDGWNRLQFTLPSIDTHIPGIGRIGGFTVGVPDIPRLHTGISRVPGSPGSEMLAILQAGERVIPAGGGGSGTLELRVSSGGDSKFASLIHYMVRTGTLQLYVDGKPVTARRA